MCARAAANSAGGCLCTRSSTAGHLEERVGTGRHKPATRGGDAATSKRAGWQLWARGSAGGPFAAEGAPNATATLRVRFRLEIAAAEGGKVKSTVPRFMCTQPTPQ